MYTQFLKADLWPDLEAFFEYDNRCSGCWCVNHHLPAGLDFEGTAAKAVLKTWVESERIFGVLAYEKGDAVPVGWLALDPVVNIPGHDGVQKREAQARHWAIHCVVPRHDYKNKGVEQLLLQAGTELARDRGALLVEAYPEPGSQQHQPFGTWNHFSGYADVLGSLGYAQQAADLAPEYALYQLRLENQS